MQVFLLEGENKKLTRALVREVGEGLPLQKVLEEGSGADWRGRREQIIRLQDTVRQLREAAAAAAAGGSDGQGTASAAISSSSVGGSLAKHEAAHRTQISKANKQKDSELQRMAAELAAAKAATEQLRLKFTGASSRRKVLEEEVSRWVVCSLKSLMLPTTSMRHGLCLVCWLTGYRQPGSARPLTARQHCLAPSCAPGSWAEGQAQRGAGQDGQRRQAHSSAAQGAGRSNRGQGRLRQVRCLPVRPEQCCCCL